MDEAAFRGRDVRSRSRATSIPDGRHHGLCQGGPDRPAPTIERQCRVTDLQPRPNGGWDVVTQTGQPWHVEHVVNAGGLWAREVGRLVGLELPLLAMEHQYLITEDMPRAGGAEGAAPLHRLRGRDLPAPGAGRHAARHLREERGAVVSNGTTPVGFRPEPAAQRPRPHRALELEVGFEHFPTLAGAGIKPGHQRARSRSRRTATR